MTECNNCQRESHRIWSDTYLAYSYEDESLLGVEVSCTVTPYQHYRLFEDGSIDSNDKYILGDADWGQLSNQLDSYDAQLKEQQEARCIIAELRHDVANRDTEIRRLEHKLLSHNPGQDVDLADFIARTVVVHPKSGSDRTVALLSILAERLRKRLSIYWLDQHIVKAIDRKGVLQVAIGNNCPTQIKFEIKEIWNNVFNEPLVEFDF